MFFLNWKILSSFPSCSPCTDSSDCACIAGLLPSSDGCGRNNDPTDGFIRGWLRQPAGGWFGVKLKPKCQEQRVKRRVTGSKVTPTLSLCLSSVVDLRGRIFPPLWTRCLVCVCVCAVLRHTHTYVRSCLCNAFIHCFVFLHFGTYARPRHMCVAFDMQMRCSGLC